MKVYRIKDWEKHFEVSQSRKCARMSWFPMPNKHDGKSFRRVMRHAKADSLYAAWTLILAVASKMPKRGLLADADGPLSAVDLSDKTGLPETCFSLAFEVLTSKEIGWLLVEDYQHAPSTLPASSSALSLQDMTLQDRTEQNRTGQESSIPEPSHPSQFPEDYISFEAAFIGRWNSLSGVNRHGRPCLTEPMRKELRARMSKPPWNWEMAMAKFPLRMFANHTPDDWKPSLKWFLKPDTVFEILDGNYDGRPFGKGHNPPGRAGGGQQEVSAGVRRDYEELESRPAKKLTDEPAGR